MSETTVRTYRGWFWGLALVGLALDLGSKELAFRRLFPGEAGRMEIIPRVFSIVRQEGLNQGALFGVGNDQETGPIANLVFMIVSGLAVVGIAAWSFRASLARDRWLSVALGLILGGAGGNLFDRIVHSGVRDFLWVYYQNAETGALSFNWPVFNLADAWLVIGACLLLLQAFFGAPAKAEATVPAANSA